MTTCGKHRTLGYAMNSNYEWVCRGCKLPRKEHETNNQTIERLKLGESETKKEYTFWYTEEVTYKAGFIAESEEQAREYLAKFQNNEEIPEFWNKSKDSATIVDFETLLESDWQA